MTTREKKSLDEKITFVASLLFAILMMAGMLYFVFTTTWLVYALATCNVVVIVGLIFMTVKEIVREMMDN